MNSHGFHTTLTQRVPFQPLSKTDLPNEWRMLHYQNGTFDLIDNVSYIRKMAISMPDTPMFHEYNDWLHADASRLQDGLQTVIENQTDWSTSFGRIGDNNKSLWETGKPLITVVWLSIPQ